jgi:hypothetical protein
MSAGNASEPKYISVDASADLSTKQFYLHAINSSGLLATGSTRGQRVHGILANDPAAANRAGLLCYAGAFPVECGGSFNPGDPITSDSAGKAIKADQLDDVVAGHAVEAGVSGARAKVIVGAAGGYITSPGTIVSEDFSGYAATDLVVQRAVAGTVGTGTAGDLNVIQLLSGTKLGLWVIGTQNIVTPAGVAGGISVGYDQTDDDGIEIFSNLYPASGAPLVVGTSPAFQFTLGVNFALANGTDDLFIGFRKEENAYQGTMTGYDTYFGLGNDTAASPMALKVREELNGAAGASTDTTDTQADATDLFVRVLVSAAGVCTVQHGDSVATLAAPTVTSAFTADTGDILVPTFRFLQANAAQTGVVKLIHWEAGPQPS